MLKLKYLFNNKDLAEMLLKNWEYDADDPHLYEYYRISSNAVYRCMSNGEHFFLRFAPEESKTRDSIAAELAFMEELRENGCATTEPIPSRSGRLVETVKTPWGVYHACAFTAASGTLAGRLDVDEVLIQKMGVALGRLHRISSSLRPLARETWEDKLDWTELVLRRHHDEKALQETIKLRESFATLPTSSCSFGLIHYDFELDNVFIDQQVGQVTTIDFDDSMYSWYAMDICLALESLREEYQGDVTPQFLSGYRKEFSVDDTDLAHMELYLRFSYLYGYARVLNAIEDHWQNEPEWMLELRETLDRVLRKRSKYFSC